MVSLGDSVKHFAGYFACSEWEPRNKSNSIVFTIIHHVVPLAIRKTISVLNRHDGNNSARAFDVLLGDIGQCDQANLAFVLQLSQSFHRRFERNNGIRNMKLINVDAVQAQSLETSIDRFAKVRWSCIVGPLIRAGTVPSSLGSNYQAGRVRKQCLRDRKSTRLNS